MLDYATDGDFTMQNSPADWLAVEASMSDDNPVSTTNYSETIEIDMEAGDDAAGEITEYEMADDVGGDVDYDGDAQLRDAELFEPQQLQGTSSVIISSPALLPLPEDHDAHPHEVPTEDYHTFLPPAEVAELTPVLSNDHTTLDGPDTHPAQGVHGLVTPSSHIEVREEALNAHPPYSTSLEHASNHTNAALFEPPLIIVSAPSGEAPDETEAVNEADRAPEPLSDSEQTNPNAEDPAPLREAEHEEPTNGPRDMLEHEASGLATEQNDTTEATSSSSEAQLAEAPIAEGDPHEISDGVYIDPPPAVVLSISVQGHDDVYLFNHPHTSPPLQNQEVNADPSTPTTRVLLHQRPTLYYESLSDVFAALRQEEFIQRISQLASLSNELTFDAYELGLMFSEV